VAYNENSPSIGNNIFSDIDQIRTNLNYLKDWLDAIDTDCDGKVNNSDKLDGNEGSYYLPTTGKAANSYQLDGRDASYFNQAIKYILIRDEKTSGTGGGDFNSGAWRTRDLNTIVDDETEAVTLNSNQLTLPAGKYIVDISCPAYWKVGSHQARLYDITNSQILLLGTTEIITDNAAYREAQVMTRSFIKGLITLVASTTLEVQHRCATTENSGFGVSAGFGTEVYTIAEFKKISDA
jgi:hypothetical protein